MLAEATLRELNRLTAYFERAACFEGHSRERLVALSEAEELFFQLNPHHYRALQVVRVAAQLGKSALPDNSLAHCCESRLMALLMDIIRDAMREGDVQFPPQQRPEEFAFTLWALAFGTRALMHTGVATSQLEIRNALGVARLTIHTLLDALNWWPLSSEWNYEATRRRVWQETFADETRQLAAAGAVELPGR